MSNIDDDIEKYKELAPEAGLDVEVLREFLNSKKPKPKIVKLPRTKEERKKIKEMKKFKKKKERQQKKEYERDLKLKRSMMDQERKQDRNSSKEQGHHRDL